MTDTGWDFFISHASPDNEQAEILHFMLSKQHRAFLASKCITAGREWDTSLLAALQDSKVIVPLISSSTKRAFFQRAEFARAVEMARAYPNRYRVVPVDLDGTLRSHDAPLVLHLMQRLTVGEPARFDEVVKRLAQVVDELQPAEVDLGGGGVVPLDHVSSFTG